MMQNSGGGREPENDPQPRPLPRDRGSPEISTSDVMLVQETLQVHGHYRGEVDGIPGSKTMRAVRAFKKQNKLPVTNKLNAEFVEHLRQI